MDDINMQATEPHDCSGLDKLRERLEACDQDRPMLVHPALVDDLFDKIDMLRQILDAERAAQPSVQVPPGYMLVGPGVVHAGGGSFDGFAKKQINAAQRLATELQTPPAAPQGDSK